ncbi:MAG: DUF3102 domain-containing protein [Lawsonibacter sp.]
MGKVDLGQLIAQTMELPMNGRSIEVITNEILDAKRTGGEAILTIGRCLVEAKDILPHGEWIPWLNEQVEFSERTARRFMRLYRECSNRPALADLGATKALALLALPPEEREAFVAEHNVIDMSARQLEQAIKERDDARKEAEAAKADAIAAEQARLKMEEDVKRANASLETILSERQAADQETIAKIRAEVMEEMQDKLNLAIEAEKNAEAKWKSAEFALDDVKRKLEEQNKVEKKSIIDVDKDKAQFEILFLQGQELINKMNGYLLKARTRQDLSVAHGMEKAMVTLADLLKGYAN